MVMGLLFNASIALSQAPEQDCFNAIYVCNPTYSQPNAYSGNGTVQELPVGVSCLTNESNSVWYQFNAITSGSLTFQIDPNNVNDDYDFAVYNLTGDSCSGIPLGLNLPVRCNYSSTAGSTGLQNGAANNTEPSNGSNQCAPLQVTAGETYVLLVNNFTNTPNGYTLNFGGSASVVDTDAPVMDSISIGAGVCNPDRVWVNLNEQILCSSIATDGSDFTISGPGGVVVTQALGIGCTAGALTDQIRLRFDDFIMTAGTYTITVQTGSDGNTITDFCGNAIPAGTTITFTVQYIGPEVTITNVIHSGCTIDDGSATANVSGGTQPYTYTWNSSPSQTTPTATGLGVGTYRVTVYDQNGCRARETVTINNINAPSINVSNNTPVTCNGGSDGSITVAPSGGSGPYNYQWNTSPPQNTPTASNLDAGPHIVTVTDANNCQVIQTIIVQEPDEILAPVAITNASCGVADGEATVNAQGGTTPFAYQWSTNPPQNTPTATNLFAGVYSVTVTDANACSVVEPVIIVNITAPDAYIDTVIPSCGLPNAQATVAVNAGNPPFTYEWSTNPTQNTPTATGLLPGSYYVIVTDVFNCVQIVNVKVDSIPPPILSVDNITEPDCGESNGEVEVSTTQGTTPFTYMWDNGQTGNILQDVPEGIYEIIVTDAYSCADTLQIELEQIPGSSEFEFDASCQGFPTSFTSITDINPTEWLWDFGDGNTSTLENPEHIYTDGGNYTVTLTLTGGCMPDSVTQEIEVYANPDAAFVTDPTIIGTRTSVDFNYSGSPAITYLWDLGNGEVSSQMNPTTLYPDSGQYTVVLVVEDDNGCMDTLEQIIEVIQEPAVFLPNAFSPEGYNSRYIVKGMGVTDISIRIFSRWGDVLYAANTIEEAMLIGWDGTYGGNLMPQGVYGYHITADFINGKHFEDTGTISIIK